MAEPNQTVDPMEMLAVILKNLNESQTQQLKDFAQELRKPTDREQKKIDEEDARLQRHQQERLDLARAEEQAKENRRRGCGHVRYHPISGQGVHLWRAQIHTPAGRAPYAVPTCLGCNDQTPPIPVTPEMMMQGVNLDKYPGLTRDALVKWAESYRA